MSRSKLLFTYLVLLSTIIMADNEALMRFAGNIHQFNELFPQEKVYLQFDNTAYFQGETIWFKAFVVKSSNLNRTSSKVLYVDLLSPNGVLLKQQKLKIVAGQADGCIELMDYSTEQARELRGIQPYPSGYYEIRAYTQYMLNFSDDIIFSRVFPVYQLPQKEGEYDNPVLATDPTILIQNRPEEENLSNVNVTFYPEGGHLVRDLLCRVAFKATDEKGMGINGKLSFIGDDGLQVEAESGHEGMGSFVYTPSKNKKDVYFEYQGKKYCITLPAPRAAGYSMMADNVSRHNQLLLFIRRSLSRVERTIGLTVTCRGELLMFKELSMRDGENHFSFDTTDWPVGVCRIVIFTDRGEVLAARSIYNGNTKYLPPTIRLKLDRLNNNAFEQIRLSLELKDRNGNPFRDRFCVSVRDASDYGTVYSDNLLTDLLLTSDLKGFIHNPSYYFESSDKKHSDNLDLLCMIQGWERYDWEYMTGNRFFQEKRQMEDSLSLSGWVMSNRITKDRSLNNVKIYVAVAPHLNNNVELGQAITCKDGSFAFYMKDFYGQADLTMRLSNANNIDMEPSAKIRLERVYTPSLRAFCRSELQPSWSFKEKKNYNYDVLNDNNFPSIISKIEGVTLPAVNIEEKRKYVDYFTFRAFDVGKDVETELDFGNYTTDVNGYLIDKGYTVWCPVPNMSWIGVETESSEMLGLDHSYAYIHSDEYNYYYGSNIPKLDNDPSFLLNKGGTYNQNGTEMISHSSGLINNYYKLNGHNVVWYVHDENKYYNSGLYAEPWNLDTQDVESILVFNDLLSLSQIIQHAPLYAQYLESGGLMSLFYSQMVDAPVNMLVDIKLKPISKIQSPKDKRNLGKRVTILEGFTRSHSFYAPEYPNGGIVGDVDYRRTLYWNPNVITDENGWVKIEFYNNSYSKKFNISGSGITAGGMPYVIDEDF